MIKKIIICIIITTAIVSLAEKHPCDGWLIHNEMCYRFTNKEMSYESAQHHCKELGSEVLVLKSQEESTFLTKLLANEFLIWSDVWVGITLRNGTRNATLDDGSQPIYTNWAPNQPDMNLMAEKCTEMMFGKWHNDWTKLEDHLGQWNDCVCNDTNAVFCEKPLPQQFRGCKV